jgi:hypothetical protein
MDIYYENQKLFCKKERLPLFANETCSHRYKWVRSELYGKIMTLGEMLEEIHGPEKAAIISSSELITGCPMCGRTWCD